MGDGSKRQKGLILCTDNFTLQENVKLVNILILKFNIKPTIQKEKDKYRIYINGNCLLKIKPFILPFFDPSMLYKINDTDTGSILNSSNLSNRDPIKN